MRVRALLAGLLLFMSISITPAIAFADGSSAASIPALVASPSAVPLAAISPTVPVAEIAAPPAWAQTLMVQAKALPVVGPIVSKVLLYAGIVGSILTVLAGAVMGILQILLASFNYAGLAKAAAVIDAFSKGRLLYWLKYFSLFNAKKPE